MTTVGSLVTYKAPKYGHQNHLYVVLGGWTDQNGLNYKVVSYDCGLQMSVLDREVNVVGQLSGDAFYDLKGRWWGKKNPDDIWHSLDQKIHDGAVYLRQLGEQDAAVTGS